MYKVLHSYFRRGSILRPAISVTLLKAEEQVDCVMYVLRVIDVRSGVDWVIRRRFREFFELREVMKMSLLSSIGSIWYIVCKRSVCTIGLCVIVFYFLLNLCFFFHPPICSN